MGGFERRVTASHLRKPLRRTSGHAHRLVRRGWPVTRSGTVSDYEQFQHLAALLAITDEDATGPLRGVLPVDYQVKTDIYVGAERPASALPLHTRRSRRNG